MYSALSDKIERIAPTYKGIEHGNKAFLRYRLTPSITILDSVGLSQRNIYQDNEFLEFVMKGQVPVGENLIQKRDTDWKSFMNRLRTNYLSYLNSTNIIQQIENEVHSVLFFVNLQTASDERALKDVKLAFERVSDMGYNPFVVLTHTQSEHREQVLEIKRRKLADDIGVPMNRIWISSVYLNETEKVFQIDRHNMRLLMHALELVDNHLTYRIDNLITEIENPRSLMENIRLTILHFKKEICVILLTPVMSALIYLSLNRIHLNVSQEQRSEQQDHDKDDSEKCCKTIVHDEEECLQKTDNKEVTENNDSSYREKMNLLNNQILMFAETKDQEKYEQMSDE